MSRPLQLAATLAIAATSVAFAQSAPRPSTEMNTAAHMVPRSSILAPQTGDVRVQVSTSLFVPASAGDSEAAMKAQEGARRALYESAARECDVLRAVIAKECRLEGINVHVNVSRAYGQLSEGFTATGNFSYRVTLK